MQERFIEQLIVRYIKDKDVVSIGSSDLGERFLKKLAIALEEKNIPINSIEFVPTSMRNAAIASTLGLPIADINEKEVDVAIEFADMVDDNFNFIKRNSLSFVRDKMIAQSAGILIVICDEKNFVKKLRGRIPFEVATFGWKRTMNQLDSLGKARRRMEGRAGTAEEVPFKTETGHYVIDADIDKIFSYDELEFESKQIPGVLETGLFVGFADKIILHGKEIRLFSRTEGE